ncbi:Muscle M-line assembly protein unc-89, putative isoform 2 [Melia azedarach]|uniref:Muscle M-line assembly protein unc-89, putative isoform 2 n=1 Tax=Melia azedarach TaxID=155640 RepID=A0ACC1Y3W9_MELAZ|nr:Muscle M-line assembly protein unc-89, putative isoform 2 [Melia azedarach]
MPLLDIATAQSCLQNHLGPLRAQNLAHAKLLPSKLTSGDDKSLCFLSKSFQFSNKAILNFGHLETRRCKLVITAVATLEHDCLVRKEDEAKNVLRGGDSGLLKVQFESSDGEKEVDEREKLRRMRISKANKGNTPWNKGRKHSPETLQRIRERTRLAMQNPKVKMKLINLGHAQSEETRKKIGVGVRMGWEKRREKLMVQENCYFEWQNLIAEVSRRGLAGETDLQWDSYNILDEQLKQEWLESVEQRKTMPRLKGSKRAPKSPEQRRKIAEAIAAKWADPEYRERVCAGLSKFHGSPVGAERKPKRKPSGIAQSTKRMSTKKKDTDSPPRSEPKSRIEKFKLRRSNTPLYKDPSASSKLEMIKNIRAQRAAAESKKTEAIERARLLIAEAEKAAKALEVAAVKSPIARASLIETRKLIAEAIQSIASIESGQITSDNEYGGSPPPVSDVLVSQGEKEAAETENKGLILNHPERIRVNGNQSLAPVKDEDFNFASFTMPGKLNGEELLPTNSNGYALQTLDLESLITQSDSADSEPNGNGEHEKNSQPNGSKIQNMEEEIPSKPEAVTKRWVCGRLVKVTEGA